MIDYKSPLENISELEDVYENLKLEQDKILDMFNKSNPEHSKLLIKLNELKQEVRDLISGYESVYKD
jgi:hypothetical protein